MFSVGYWFFPFEIFSICMLLSASLLSLCGQAEVYVLLVNLSKVVKGHHLGAKKLVKYPFTNCSSCSCLCGWLFQKSLSSLDLYYRFCLSYSPTVWCVKNFLLVPGFVRSWFPEAQCLLADTSEFSIVKILIVFDCILRVAYIQSFEKIFKPLSYTSSMISWCSELQRLVMFFSKLLL